jgi:hypothetical protein
MHACRKKASSEIIIIIGAWVWHAMEKIFTGGSQTVKFVKIFSLKNFPLYSIFALFT